MSKDASGGVEIRFGMAAWGYDHLKGALYPPGTPARERLRRYAQVYPFVEVDALRYAWPTDVSLDDWVRQTPPSFRFVPKMHRSLTHGEGLSFGDAAAWWRALMPLWARVPCVLLQFPASFRHSEANLAHVLDLMAPVGAPCVVEFRHASWRIAWPDVVAAGCVPSWTLLDGVPLPEVAGDFGYVRVIGDRRIPAQDLGALRRDRLHEAEALGQCVADQAWASCDVVVTNHFEGSAPWSIERIAQAWGVPGPDRLSAGRGEGQARLF